MSAAKAKKKTSTRWTEEQVRLLLEQVKGSSTAKEAFEVVAKQLGKSSGTVQQKYYNLQKQAGGAVSRRRGRPVGSAATAAASAAAAAVRTTRSSAAGSAMPGVAQLRNVSVDELVGLATRVKAEVERRRKELDAASKLLAG